MHYRLLLALSCLMSVSAWAQEEVDLFELSLEELMNVEIVSASKKSENLFDAPVSSYTITRSEIAKAGATSIPEALRLCPGVIVREVTNGNYDIHLRGFDNLIRYSETYVQNNTLTLVMIDDRPVFNHNTGGTVWESLPIDLIDIERIEIVRGPSGPLFGPNAVTGVINIITRTADAPGLHAAAHVQYGQPDTRGANVAVGHTFGDQLDVTVSANYQRRERDDEAYYVYLLDQYLENPSFLPYGNVAYAEPERSLEKYGVNGFVDYQPNEQVAVSLTAGLQQAEAQRVYYNFDITALNTSAINRRYAYLDGSFYNVGVKASYTTGTDNLYRGFDLIAPQYDVRNTDVMLSYDLEVGEQLSIRPELSYQQAVIDDRDYTDVPNGLVGFTTGKVSNYTLAGSLKADYTPVEALRLIGAVRIDKFKVPNRAYASYQLAATYKIADRYLLRAVQSRAISGAFISNYLLNIPATAINATTVFSYQGRADLEVVNNTMTEVGLRAQLSGLVQLDAALFRQRIKDLSYPLATAITPVSEDVNQFTFQYTNLPLEATQTGVTLSANIVPNEKWQVKPFVTWQQTQVENLPIGIDASFPTQVSDEHQTTPSIYGGAFINYAAHRKLNVNLNTYYFGEHTLYHRQDLQRPAATDRPTGLIDNKWLVNAKVSYQVVSKLDVYVNGRNLLGNDSREFYGTDRIGRSFLVGASYNF